MDHHKKTTNLDKFDPISFLQIDSSSYSAEASEKIRKELTEIISEYVLLKLINKLSDEEYAKVSSSTDDVAILRTLGNLIPDIKQYISEETANFKREYQMYD